MGQSGRSGRGGADRSDGHYAGSVPADPSRAAVPASARRPVRLVRPVRPGRRPVVLWSTYLMLGLLGLVLGVVGAFLVPARPRVLGVPVALALVVGGVGNLLVGLFGAWGTGRRAGSGAPLAGWLAAVVPLSLVSPGDDVVVGGRANDIVPIAFLFVSVLAGLIAVGFSQLVVSRYPDADAAREADVGPRSRPDGHGQPPSPGGNVRR